MKPNALHSRLHLGERFFLVVFATLFLTLAAVFYPILLPTALAAWAGALLIGLWDLTTLSGIDDLRGGCQLPITPELGERTQVRFWVISSSKKVSRLPRIQIVLPVLETLAFPEAIVTLRRSYADGRVSGVVEVDAQTRRLGFEKIATLRLLARSPLGIWFRAFDVPVSESAFRVLPSRRQVSEQTFRDLAANQRLLYQGTRQILRGRAADQFHSVRKYQFPDSIRHIDQKKSAKFNELMTRIYDTFFDHHLVIALDLGRSMRGLIDGSYKSDYYLSACLSLAENAVKSRDRISFFGFSQKVHYLIRGSRNLQAFRPLFEGRPELRPRDEESDYTMLPTIVQGLAGQRSIVLLFTDLSKPSVLEALLKSLPAVSQRHLVVVVSVIDESLMLENRLRDFTDEASTHQDYGDLMYSYWLRDRTEVFERKVGSLGSAVLVVSEKDWLSVIGRLYGLLRSSASL